MELKQAIQELRKNEKKKFDQSIDLLVSLKGIDVKKDNITIIGALPHKIRDKKVCAFLSTKSNLVRTITNLDFPKYKDKKDLKNLIKEFDFFIAEAKLMPSVATVFGKILGPAGKMPSPQLGVLMNTDDASIKAILQRMNNAIKIKVKEAAVKLSVAKESMSDEVVAENISAAYNAILNAMPVKKDNIKSVMVKLTMSKPIKVEIK
ncbi:MAG: hypothetical protein AABX11_07185 [Nanoarchaeota archaeon]